MRLWLFATLALLLAACAAIPQKPTGFMVDQFELFSLEYSGPKTVTDIVPSGPTEDERTCNLAGMASIVQGDPALKHSYTCLRIMFRGPVKEGAVVVQPEGGNESIFEWVAFGIDYAADGTEIGGTRNLKGPFLTGDKCKAAGEDLKQDAYATGKVPSDSSLLIYCIPIPTLTEHGGIGDNEA